MIKKIPNCLTMSRLILLPTFLLMLVFTEPLYRWIFVSIYIYAAVTDFLDGYLAKKLDIGSNFGRIFDPIADKALVLTLSVLLLVRDADFAFVIVIPILIILVREFVISGIREGLASSKVVIHSSMSGKVKTAFQMIALGFLLVGGAETDFYLALRTIGTVLLYISMFMAIQSGAKYVMSFYKEI